MAAALGAMSGVAISMIPLMKSQRIKNPLNLKYSVPEMLLMAAAGNMVGCYLVL